MRRKFPFYRQLESKDCGAACLKMICDHFGVSASLSGIRDRCQLTKGGISLARLHDTATELGLKAAGVRLSWDELRNRAPLPCIIHWNGAHFVVVYDITHKRKGYVVTVADPAIGILSYPERIFRTCWEKDHESELGVALLVEPPETHSYYHNKNKQRQDRIRLSPIIKPYRIKLAGLFLSLIVSTLLSVALPFFTQAIVDKGIGQKDIGMVTLFLAGQLSIVLGMAINQLIRNRLSLKLSFQVGLKLITEFLSKLMLLPIPFFENRRVGDILQRVSDCSRIQNYVTSTSISFLFAVLSFIVYGIAMGFYQFKILIIFLLGALTYTLWVLIFMKKRRKLDYIRFQESSVQESTLIEMISGISEIKINNCGAKMRAKWANCQTRLMGITIKSLNLSQIQEIGGLFIDQTKNILITYLAARSVINGQITLGMMMSIQYIAGQLNAPIHQLLFFIQSSQDATISRERLGEIYHAENENDRKSVFQNTLVPEADIILSDVSFHYPGRIAPNAIDHLSVIIPYGRITAIVGSSGSGKTTLLKLLMGSYRPISGSISIGTTPLDSLSVDYWRAQCGCVQQDGYLFADTIAANIALSSEKPDSLRIRKAAATAQILDWIETLPKEFDTMIGDKGNGMSIGQKQRILIARAAYKEARYIFLDEATNSLDANNEKRIIDNLDMFFKGRTVVIVAHRLSTIKNADNIIVMDQGRIIEMGTHAQLMAQRKAYYQLFVNQIAG